MNNSFEHMQKLAFGKVVTETEKEVLTESALKDKIRELVHSSLGEAKKKKEDVAPQEDVDLEMSATEEMPEDTMAPESMDGIDIDPTVKSIQNSLQKAFANAKQLGDAKLATQIGNTLTMLLRDQVLGQQAMNEVMDYIYFVVKNITSNKYEVKRASKFSNKSITGSSRFKTKEEAEKEAYKLNKQ
jgi:hypothetical protein